MKCTGCLRLTFALVLILGPLSIFVLVFAKSQAQSPSTPAQFPLKSIHPPVPIVSPEAEYSPQARDRHINGICAVSLIVDAAGLPQNIQVYRCTDSVFVDSSLAATRKYKFKPGTDADGTPVPVKITVLVNYRMTSGSGPNVSVRYSLQTPPGIISAQPDSNGVYPLTGAVDEPKLTTFVDQGYGTASFLTPGKGACDVVLVVDAHGKASDAKITQCQVTRLEQPALKSLLESKFKAGHLNGKPVPVRVSVHLEFGGYSAD